MAPKKKTKGPFEDENDERSFAVALRLEVLAKRLEAVNQELIARLDAYEASERDGEGKGGETT